VEVAAESDAVLLRALVPNGSTVEVGAPMALLGEAGEQDSDLDSLLAELRVAPATSAAPVAPPEPASAAAPTPPDADRAGERIFSSPLARRILREAGLDLTQVRGTGPNGRVVRRDAERAVEETRTALSRAQPQAAPAAPTPPATAHAPVATASPEDAERIPHSRLRRTVAARLTASKRDVPHFYLRRTALIDELLALRARLNEVAPRKISVNDLVVKAAACAHEAVPEANIIWTEDHVLRFATADIAVAVASVRGLLTPVLRDAGAATPGMIARRIKAYAERADAGTLRQDELEGGSLTVTNLGMFGVEEFSAIINPPQSMILAVGAGRPEPVVVNGAVTVATRMTLTLSVDHRAIDGELAARWFTALIDALEQPLRLLV
jgi:pyruvate dehydrogenase E2 component (dihydrolipoamide acetyltransferase)